MDRAVYQFFTADHSGAIRTMNETSDALRLGREIAVGGAAPGRPRARRTWSASSRRSACASRRASPTCTGPASSTSGSRRSTRSSSASRSTCASSCARTSRTGKSSSNDRSSFAPASRCRRSPPSNPHAEPGRYRVQLIDDAAGTAIDVARGSSSTARSTCSAANERRLLYVNQNEFNVYQALVACRGATRCCRTGRRRRSRLTSSPTRPRCCRR